MSCFLSYFKLLKWGIGVFLALSLVYLPLIVLNSLGPSQSGALASFSLVDTTLGHLGNRTTFPRVYIPTTSCGEVECSITKEQVCFLYDLHGVLFAGMTMIAVGALLISYQCSRSLAS